jgi:hypothetical protein
MPTFMPQGAGGIGPRSDTGRYLRWVTVVWFCTCVVVMVLLWSGVESESGWSDPRSDGSHDLETSNGME